MTERKIKSGTIRLIKGDLTASEVEAFVFYARPDLKLGTGYGSAVSLRGGPKIQEALDAIGSCATGQAVITDGGNLKAKHIIHAVGPRFQEADEERKLGETVRAALRLAAEKGIRQLAFPPMGTGFYGIPLDRCSQVMLAAFKEHLEAGAQPAELIVCVGDNRDYKPFEARLTALGGN